MARIIGKECVLLTLHIGAECSWLSLDDLFIHIQDSWQGFQHVVSHGMIAYIQ